jgi:uncharacterized protein (DUF433 family)
MPHGHTPTPPIDIYGGRNPLELPVYPLVEIANCLHVPAATIRAWALGRRYSFQTGGEKTFPPLIDAADKRTPALSFLNAVELHVLSSMRRKHKLEMRPIRLAIDFLTKKLQIEHPLANQQMATDGVELFIERYGQILNISRDGQSEMRGVVQVYLSRIDRDDTGLPIRLYPFTRSAVEERSPKTVVMNPRVHFGRPCIAGTGIPTDVLIDRYRAGDSMVELAHDYRVDPSVIDEAIRFESQRRVA